MKMRLLQEQSVLKLGKKCLAGLLALLAMCVLLPAQAQTVSNVASASPPSGVTNTNAGADASGKVTATDTDTVFIPPKVTLTKTASASNFLVGVSGQYYSLTVAVANGPSTAAIALSDTLPTGITLSAAPTVASGTGVLSGCPASGSTLTGCSIASGAANGNTVIQIPVNVAASAIAGGATNTATANGGGDPTCTGTGSCTATTPAITVTYVSVVANPSSGSVSGVPGGTAVANAVSGDTIGGSAATLGGSGNATVVTQGAWPAYIHLNTTTGAVTVDPASPAGTNPVQYKLCEAANPTNCSTSTITVTITPVISLAKAASASSFTVGKLGQSYTITVTVASGATTAPITLSDSLPTGISLSAAPTKDASSTSSGTLSGCPASGSTLTGCQIASGAGSGTIVIDVPVTVGASATSGTNTASASGGGDPACVGAGACTVTTTPVGVGSNAVVANPDNFTAPNGTAGNANIGSVYANDTLNGSAVNLADILGSVQSPATPLTPGASVPVLDPNTGVVSVSAGTPVGTYSIQYQICEKLNPTNCASATVTIIVPTGGKISGSAYLDLNHDRVQDAGDTPLAGYTVELLQGTGSSATLVASTQTSSTGSYVLSNIPPGNNYQIRFRSPSGAEILGTPYSQSVSTQNGNTSTGVNQLYTATPGSLPAGSTISGITVYSGDNTIAQNLPLDPTGVVYDSVTRNPISNVTVRIHGPAGFNPATQLIGGTDTVTTGSDGVYQFLLIGSPPSGVYTLEVVAPTGYLAGQATAGHVAPAQGTLIVPATDVNVQPNTTAPAVGVNGLPGTAYYLAMSFNFGSGAGEVRNNHIPLDPLNVGGRLQVQKTASSSAVEVGDSLQYTITVTNSGASPMSGVVITDMPPAGFLLIDGTMVVQVGASRVGVPAVKVAGQRGFTVTIPGILGVGQQATLTYYMRASVGSALGNGTNTVYAGLPGQPNLASDKATVRVRGGVLGNEACLVGKVYLDQDGDRMQNNTPENVEIGIPGVKVVMETGAYAITDVEGKYSICPITPQTHVLRVVPATLPAQGCFGLVPSSNQNAGDGGSIFVDAKNGELHRADFILAGCSSAAIERIKQRRGAGAPPTEAGMKLPRELSAPPAASGGLPAVGSGFPSAAPGSQ